MTKSELIARIEELSTAQIAALEGIVAAMSAPPREPLTMREADELRDEIFHRVGYVDGSRLLRQSRDA